MAETGPEIPDPDGPIRRTSRLDSRGMRLVLGLSVATAFFAFIEISLRLTLGPPPAPVQVYSGLHEKDQWFEVLDDGVHTTYQHDHGGRGTFIPYDTDGTRFAVLGGSSVRGGSVDLRAHQEFANLLQEQVGAEVFNLGRLGLDSHDLVAILEEIKDVEMDAWIVYTGHNDFGNTYFKQRYAGWSGGALARAQGGLGRLQLYWQLSRMVGMAKGNTVDQNPHNQFAAPGIEPAQKERALTYLEQNLRRMAWLAREAEVELLFVVPSSSLYAPPVGSCGEEESCAQELFREGALVEARDTDSIPLRAPTVAQEVVRKVAREEGTWLIDADADLPASRTIYIQLAVSSWIMCTSRSVDIRPWLR